MSSNPLHRAAAALALTLTVAALAAPAAAQDAPPATPGPMDLFVAFSRSQLAATGFTRHAAEIAGQELVWWEKAPPEAGRRIVLVHGVNDQAGTWFQVAPRLAEEHHLYLVDLPGHGESAPPAGALAMSTVVDGFTAWLAALPGDTAEPPVLVGNSMGAWVALRAAHLRPDLVGRVIAVNGGPLRPDTGGLNLLPATREEARALMAALRDPASPPTPDAVLDDLVRRVPASQATRMFAANDDLESHLLEGRLAEISAPVDLLWGASDRYLGRDYPDRLLAGLPAARLTEITACGHVPQIECPQRFLDLLREVLALGAPSATAPGDGR